MLLKVGPAVAVEAVKVLATMAALLVISQAVPRNGAVPDSFISVGTERVNDAALRKLRAIPSSSFEEEAKKLGYVSSVAGQVLVVWSPNDPLLARLREFAQAFDTIAKKAETQKPNDFPLSALGESGKAVIESMPWNLEPQDNASLTVTASLKLTFEVEGRTISARHEPEPCPPATGFALRNEPKDPATRKTLSALNDPEYVRVAEVLAGSTSIGRKSVGEALSRFDRAVDIEKSAAQQAFLDVFAVLEKKLTQRHLESDLKAKSFSELSRMTQAEIRGQFRRRWQSFGFASPEAALKYLNENTSLRVNPAVNFGVRFTQGEGRATSGYYELVGPNRNR